MKLTGIPQPGRDAIDGELAASALQLEVPSTNAPACPPVSKAPNLQGIFSF
jgi:hypothetical protein